MERYVCSHLANGEIYVGLLPYIKDYCKSKNVKYTIEEGVEDERNVVDKVARGFIKSLKPRSGGKSLKIRDYQIDAVHTAISRNRSLIVSPTASGKSLIIYSLVRYYQMDRTQNTDSCSHYVSGRTDVYRL